jgi:hypothetical protein
MAYAAELRGESAESVALLRAAYSQAAKFDQRVDMAIAAHQLGKRSSGDVAHAWERTARALLAEVGASEKLLAEG